VARTAFATGDEVYVIARRGAESLAARDIELQFAKIDGAEIITFKEP